MHWDEIKEILVFIFGVIGVVCIGLVIFSVIVALVWMPIDYASCAQKNNILISQGFEPKYQWGFWTGCNYILDSGVLIAPDNIFYNDFNGELLLEELR